MATFDKRIMRLTFTLGQGDFGGGQGNVFTVSGLRTSATITRAGGLLGQLELRVFGIPLDVMNKLTIVGQNFLYGNNNTIVVEAGSVIDGYGVAFQGTIRECWIDAKGMPDVSLTVVALTNGIAAFAPAAPTSFSGTIDIALAMASLAGQMGLTLENGGVSGVVSNPYLHGSLKEQIQELASYIPCNWVIETDRVAIWPINGARGGEVPLIAPDTGMVGYPAHTQGGFTVQMLYNPSVTFGGVVQVESGIAQANGRWTVYSLIHDLETEMPNGKWFTTVDCNLFGLESAP